LDAIAEVELLEDAITARATAGAMRASPAATIRMAARIFSGGPSLSLDSIGAACLRPQPLWLFVMVELG
jgi:hypothetical protein